MFGRKARQIRNTSLLTYCTLSALIAEMDAKGLIEAKTVVATAKKMNADLKEEMGWR